MEQGAATPSGGPVGIWVWDANNALIQNNESHHNRTGSTADGGGFDFDGGVTNSVMQYNYSHDNAGPGYGVYQFRGEALNGFTVRYNVSANDAPQERLRRHRLLERQRRQRHPRR